jgi:putative hydrolase of HD superfamily
MSALLFLRIAGQLKRVQRAGWIRAGVGNGHGAPVESVADHSWRVALMTLAVSSEAGVDVGRALRMALLHDVQEALVGDIMPPQHSGVSEADKHAKELAAVEELRALLGADNALGAELVELWNEYEEGTSATARFVKDLDKAEMLLQADTYERNQDGLSLQDFYDTALPKIQSQAVRELVFAMLQERRDRDK